MNKLVIFSLSFILIFTFQNCSETEFIPIDSAQSDSRTPDSSPDPNSSSEPDPSPSLDPDPQVVFPASTSPDFIWATYSGSIPTGFVSHRGVVLCRAEVDGGFYPGTFLGDGVCRVGFDGKEEVVSHFQILTKTGATNQDGSANGVSWQFRNNMIILNQTLEEWSFAAGQEPNGEPIYACLSEFSGNNLRFGKTWSGSNPCVVARNGIEVSYSTSTNFPVMRNE